MSTTNVFKENNGKWTAQVQIGYYENGRPKYKRFRADTKKEAVARVEEYRIDTNNLTIGIDKADYTVYDYISNYIKTYKTNTLKPSSLTRDYGILNNQIKSCIGSLYISQLSSQLIQTQLINKLVTDGYSHSTIHKAYTLLNESLNKAVDDNLIAKNACNGVNMPTTKILTPKQITILSSQEASSIVDVAYTNKFDNGYAVALILYTGLRCGELCALKLSDIDIQNKTMIVKRNISISNLNGKRTVVLQEGTKTKLKRTVPLNDKAIEIINIIKDKYDLKNDDFLFQAKTKIPDTSAATKTYNRMLNYADIHGKTGVHTLRHTFASTLISKGVDIKVVSEILGHSSVSFTYDTYIHLFPEQKTNALNDLEY